MSDFIDRIKKEKEDLDIKISSLSKFLVSPKFKELDMDNQDLLIRQYEIMENYSEILDMRLLLLLPDKQ